MIGSCIAPLAYKVELGFYSHFFSPALEERNTDDA